MDAMSIVAWYHQPGILVSVDAMRPARQVAREILAAFEVLRPLVDLIPEELRRSVDLTGLDAALDAAFGP
jgi:adenylate kinase